MAIPHNINIVLDDNDDDWADTTVIRATLRPCLISSPPRSAAIDIEVWDDMDIGTSNIYLNIT